MENLDNLEKKTGLPIGFKLPIAEMDDIYGNTIRFEEQFKKFEGILIDFFRGAF
jgi:hypothetical protein